MVEHKTKSDAPRLTKLEEYLYANLMAWIFLGVVAGVSFFTCGGVWDEAVKGVMEFLFVIIGGGIALVSALDYLYDKFREEPTAEGKK